MTREDNQLQWAMLIAPVLEQKASGTGPAEGWRLWGAFPNTLTIHELALELASIVEQHSNIRYMEAVVAEQQRADRAEARVTELEAELRVWTT